MTGCAILDSGIAARQNGKRFPCETLYAENAKLRELVRTIYMCSDIRCDQCEYKYGNTCAFDAEAEMRELGVEVDDFDATPSERHKGYDWYLRLRELGVEVTDE